jgi:ABC-2 type transport system permease protein
MRSWALVIGHVTGAVTNGVFSVTVFIIIAALSGVRLESGPLGLIVLIILATLHCLVFSLLGAGIALRSGTGEAVQGMFPLFFAALFLSSVNMPRDLIEVNWFKTVATINPVSYMAEGSRSLIIASWDWVALGRDIAVVLVLLVIGLTISGRALGKRLART